MTRTINVKNISPSSTDDEVRRFFTFCGQFESFELQKKEGQPSTATITYLKESAAGIAVLLDGTELGKNKLEIEAAPNNGDAAALSPEGERNYDAETDVPQEHKPRGRIVAELLAQGYAIGDRAIAQAIELDKTHGISTQFESWLKNLEDKYKPQERARDLDTKYDLSGQLLGLISRWRTYFEKPLESASQTPLGIRLRGFYDSGMKTVESVHKEAKFLQEQKYTQKCPCDASAAACTCVAGSCACDNCPKNIYAQKDACCKSEGCCSDTVACEKKACPEGKTCAGKSETCECKSGQCACVCTKCECKTKCKCASGKSACVCGGEEECKCASGSKACECKSGKTACICGPGECKCVAAGKTKEQACECASGGSACVCAAGECKCAESK